MGIQVLLLIVDRRGVSIMTADSRTRRVTHLTLNVARVELEYLCGKTEIMFRSPRWDPGRLSLIHI